MSETRHDLGADAFDRVGVEARRVERQLQHVERLVAMSRQRTQRPADRIAISVKGQFDRELVEPFMERS